MTGTDMAGGCRCGHVRYEVHGPTLFRAHCHCTICQAFNDAPFGDILVMRAKHVVIHNEAAIAFRYHMNPPLLKRGRCSKCDGVAIERMNIPLMPPLVIVPAQTLTDAPRMPELAFHMFYHRRVSDVDDPLPKYSGYLRSQMGFSAALMRSLFHADAPGRRSAVD